MAHEFLSPEGRVRKLAMRMSLEETVVRRHTMKKRMRGGAVAGMLLLLAWLVWPGDLALPKQLHDKRNDFEERIYAAYLHFDYKVVTGDKAAISGWMVRGGDVSKFHVRDDDLPGLLEEAGHPSGIMRVGDKVFLTQPLAVATSD